MARARPGHARHLGMGEGKRVRLITDVLTIKALTTDTGGAYSLMEVATPPGGGCPPHAQHYEEKTVFVLEGQYAFLLGEERVELGPGAYVFIPRGTPHAYTNIGRAPARLLLLVTPGDIHDEFLEEVSDRAEHPAWEPDMPGILAVAPKYGIIFARPATDGEPDGLER